VGPFFGPCTLSIALPASWLTNGTPAKPHIFLLADLDPIALFVNWLKGVPNLSRKGNLK
jgi:hypothetical protein